ncbi:MAG: hypothetical protein ABIQ74_05305 [Chitinophagales bacterium]
MAKKFYSTQATKLITVAICLASVLYSFTVSSQGCVAIRSVCTGSALQGTSLLGKGDMQFGIGFRYFKSYKHYVGDVEQKQRVEEGSNVINYVHSFDLLYSYGLSKQWFLSADVPLSFNTRSQLTSNTDTSKLRTLTNTRGLGDIRLTANRWMFDTHKSTRGNLSLGLGIKFPTGKYYAKDTFLYKGTDYSNVYREVDQRIQPGDGGWGISFESSGFLQLTKPFYGYYSIFYLFNPMDTNSAATYRSNPFEQHMSIPDQFLFRGGISYYPSFIKGLSGSIGARYEGIPVKDLVGKSDGFRRPGYIVDAEPGLAYEYKNHSFSVFVPVALYRNRTQSVADENYQNVSPTDPVRHGDAAFADYVIFLNYSFKLGHHHTMALPVQVNTPD